VMSGALGIPISNLSAGNKNLAGRSIMVNQSQLDRQKPNISEFARSIE
jgi:chromosome partitioning protein